MRRCAYILFALIALPCLGAGPLLRGWTTLPTNAFPKGEYLTAWWEFNSGAVWTNDSWGNNTLTSSGGSIYQTNFAGTNCVYMDRGLTWLNAGTSAARYTVQTNQNFALSFWLYPNDSSDDVNVSLHIGMTSTPTTVEGTWIMQGNPHEGVETYGCSAVIGGSETNFGTLGLDNARWHFVTLVLTRNSVGSNDCLQLWTNACLVGSLYSHTIAASNWNHVADPFYLGGGPAKMTMDQYLNQVLYWRFPVGDYTNTLLPGDVTNLYLMGHR